MNKEGIDLYNLDIDKPFSNMNSLLEMLIISLSRNLNLKPNQIVVLLTNNLKYLAHIIIKGIKQDFKPIQEFFKEIHQNIPLIVKLLNKDDGFARVVSFLQVFFYFFFIK